MEPHSVIINMQQSRNTGLMTKETTVIGKTTADEITGYGKCHSNVYVI